jgi:hypothetical protein
VTGIVRFLVLLALIVSVAVAASTAEAAAAPERAASASAVCESGKVHFAKTKFVLHAGLAFGVFHHFIYKPFKAGAFKSGAPGRLKAAAKAAVAALFVYHELKLACKDAENSSVLRPLLAPLTLIVTAFNKLAAKLKGGKVAAGDLTSAETTVKEIELKAAAHGVGIKELTRGFSGG